MTITAIELLELEGVGPGQTSVERSAHPLDAYPGRLEDYQAGASPGLRAIYLIIETDAGISGLYGPLSRQQAFLISDSLSPLLMGQDALAVRSLHDQMLRVERHGRAGLFVTAVSAVDNALWDIKGKAYGKPVWELLGGPTRGEIPAYASMLGHSVDPEAAAETARRFANRGYTAQKWFFRHGPMDGAEGRRRNLDMAAAVRAAVGEDYDLMLDAFMSWDLPYAQRMARELETINPRWLEEPLPPERLAELADLSRRTLIPIASGEHAYTRWQMRGLIETAGVRVIQADPDWAGGITEQMEICTVCSVRGVPVVAHGHTLIAALHVAAAQPAHVVPMVEYLVLQQKRSQYFHRIKYEPLEGRVALPTRPGLGIELDDSVVTSRRELNW